MNRTEANVPMEELMPLILESLNHHQSVRIYPKGTSMLPLLRQGIDSVELSALPKTLHPYDLPLYRRDSGQYVLHRIIKTGDTFTCMGDGQLVKEQNIRPNQMIALVTAIYRKETRIPVTAPTYRLYCRFWYWTYPLRKFCRRGKNWLHRRLS